MGSSQSLMKSGHIKLKHDRKSINLMDGESQSLMKSGHIKLAICLDGISEHDPGVAIPYQVRSYQTLAEMWDDVHQLLSQSLIKSGHIKHRR